MCVCMFVCVYYTVIASCGQSKERSDGNFVSCEESMLA